MRGWNRWLLVASACSVALLAAYLLTQRTPQTELSRRLFVSNYKGNTVSVIDDESAREIKVLDVGDSPDGMAIRADPPLVVVANGTASRITFIDPVALEVIGTATVGGAPEGVVFALDGTVLFVASTKDRVVNVIDPDRRSPVGDPIPFAAKPRRLVASPDGKRVYVLLSADRGKVAAINAETRTVGREIQVGGSIRSLAITPDGRHLLVGRFDNDTVISIDTLSMLPAATYEITTGYGIVAHPTEPLFYSMASFDDTVGVLDMDSGKVVDVFSYGSWPTYSAITRDGKFLYVVHEESDNVAKIDTATNELIVKIAVGAEPGDVVIYDPRS